MQWHGPPGSPARELQLEAPRARRGSKFPAYKAGFSLIGDLMNRSSMKQARSLLDSERPRNLLWRTEICQVSCSENHGIASPCILIAPTACDLGAACCLNVTVSLAFCSSHQAGRGCSGDAVISSSAALAREAVIPLLLGEACVTPRALRLGTLLQHGAPRQAPSARRISARLVMGRVRQAHPFSQRLVCHWLLSIKGRLQILRDPSTSTWYVWGFLPQIVNAGSLK